MKQLLCLLLSLMLLMGLAACGSAPAATNTTPETTLHIEIDEAVNPDDAGAFSFTLSEVSLTPGAEFKAEDLPEAESTYEVPSCAIEGTDLVYSYPEAEVTVYNDGTKGIIYSIYLVDENTATDEGLYLGDDRETVETLYGTDYTEEESVLVYTKGQTQLHVMVEDDLVVSIEYYMVTE